MSTRRRGARDFSEEIRAHIDIETDRLIAEGMDPAEARLAARRSFGSTAAAEERFYESHRWMWLDRGRQDLRDAVRSLARYPIATAVGILSIAAGMGVAASALTIRDIIFHRPPPAYADAEQLSEIRVARNAQPIFPIGSYAPGGLYGVWSAALGPATIAAAQPPQAARDVRMDDRTESIRVRAVTAELFDVLGVRPVVGRTFTDTPAAPDAAPAMLSFRLWQQWFDGHPDVVGRVIWIDRQPHTIVGVLPRGFWMSALQPSVWTVLNRSALDAEANLEVIARRPRGMTHDALRRALEPLMTTYASAQPADRRQLRMEVVRVEGTPMGKQMSIALPWVLGIASLLTLLIACANVAILMIVRWTAREHEIAIRASLGASRGRLVRTLLTESIVVATCGGVLGVGAAYGLLAVLVRSGPPEFFNAAIRPAILAQSAAATLVAGLLIGIAPALLETRRLHGNPMRANALTEPLRQRWRHALVVLEISVTVALLVVASAFINGYRRTASADLGFMTRPMLSARVEHPGGVPLDAVLDIIRGVAGVADAAASTTVPFTTSGPRTRVALDSAGSNAVSAERAAITPSFFSTLDVPIRSGRAFTSRDAGSARVAIVNEALARRLFGRTDAIGGRVWLDTTAYDVVGVAANFANQPFFRDYDPRIFVPLIPDPKTFTRAAFVIRARDDPAPLVPTVRRAIRGGAPGTIAASAVTFDTIRTISGQEILVGAAPLVPLILIGLLLTTAGIYGVLAFAIARRSRELAVRVAIGATNRDLVGLVAMHSLRLVLMGVTVGAGFTFALTRVVRAGGGGGSPFDASWTAFAIPVAIIVVIAALATWVPSRRVRKIDPAALLRTT